MENSTEARKNFILCLQKYRTISKFDISEKKICPIEKILNVFLTKVKILFYLVHERVRYL